MMISRTIGYQEKNEKHSTAPMRNAQAPAFRLALGSTAPRRRPAAACGAVARRATPVSTFAIRFSSSLRQRADRARGGRLRSPPAPRPGRGSVLTSQNECGFPRHPALFARIALTLAAAVLSSDGMSAFGSVSTASMTGSSVL